jgi:hypothetical protein
VPDRADRDRRGARATRPSRDDACYDRGAGVRTRSVRKLSHAARSVRDL